MNELGSDIKNIKELSLYLDRIQSIETSRVRSENVLLSNIWGVLMIFAGLMDLNVVYYAGYSPHFFVWFFAVGVGFIIQKLITSQPMIYDELIPKSHPRQIVRWYHLAIMFLMFMGTLIVAHYDYTLILPYVLIVQGTLETIFNQVNIEDRFVRYKERLFIFIPSLLAALFLVCLGLFDPNLAKFQGFCFGLIIGTQSFYEAKKEKEKIKSAKASEIEIMENIDENEE